MVETIEANLLAPIRRTLGRWMQDEKSTVNTFLGVNGVLTRIFFIFKGRPLIMSPLALLSFALERVDNAKEESMLVGPIK